MLLEVGVHLVRGMIRRELELGNLGGSVGLAASDSQISLNTVYNINYH